jgi:hypothetical protein
MEEKLKHKLKVTRWPWWQTTSPSHRTSHQFSQILNSMQGFNTTVILTAWQNSIREEIHFVTYLREL